MQHLTTIGFDADDTLWQNEQFFRMTEKRFVEMLGAYADESDILRGLLEAERRNLAAYGFGIKGFTLSMIETAVEVTKGRVPASTIADILDAGREMLRHPVVTLPHARETLERLAGTYARIFAQHGEGPEKSMMVGNSLKSDVLPAIEAGCWGVHVPHELTWVLDHAEAPRDAPRFRQVSDLGALSAMLATLR